MAKYLSHRQTSALPLVALLRRFARNQRGTTAIEFAILAIPFFSIVFAILETALVFLASQILDSAVQDASRLIRTGQAKTASYNEVSFKAAVCDRLYGMFDCTALKIKATHVDNFTAASTINSTPLDPKTGDWTTDWKNDSYDGGTGSNVIMVEAYYKWPVFVNLGGFGLQNTGDGKRMLAAVRVFRNEPFS